MMVNPFRPVQLGATVALSTVLSGGVSTLPPGNFSDVARALVGFCGVALSTKVVCETLVDDANAESTAQESEVQAALTRDLFRANAAYYREFPHHWKARKPVPDEWLELWGQTGGKPYLALHPPSPQAFTPITPIAQTQHEATQHQAFRGKNDQGGSFDLVAASDSPDTGWGDYEPRPVPPIAQTPIAQPFTLNRPDPDAWVSELVNYPSVLVFGAPGSGKTTFAEELVTRRSSHQVIAIDPHYQPGKWSGAEIVGAGFDYPAITAFMLDLLNIVQHRYQAYSQGVTQFPPITIIAEELTNWSSRVGGSEKLIELIPDARKIGLHFLFVAHDRTITALGGKSGLRKMLDATLCEVELLVKADVSGVVPAMKARLKMPNQPVREVTVPRFTHTTPPPPIQTPEPPSLPSFEPDFSPVVQGSGLVVQTPEPPLNALPPSSEPGRDREAELLTQFAEFKALGMNKAQICFALFGAKKGGTNAYKMASEFYDRLNSKYSEMHGDNAA